ncbi:endospore germination permease [Cohnella sp. GbtcB17]|uniref:GerAB/ArcD/ProY family transporter n=1 Tax=Cohnella sp. GbtcB17 TaxID=2824762 RepID=UPI001C30BADC|nr:endospore germination permease [Cohnella sp. GbtcB17]
MITNGKISVRQFTILVVIFTVGSAILYVPGLLAEEAKQDAWLAGIVGTGFGLLSAWPIKSLAERFPGQRLTEYSVVLLGKIAGPAVSIVYFLYFFMLSAMLLRDVGDFVTTQMMPETPIQAILIAFMFISIYAVRLGIEVIARAAEFFFPILIGLASILFILLVPKIDFVQLTPVLERGIGPAFKAAPPFIAIPFLQLSVFLMLFPLVSNAKRAGRVFMGGVLAAGMFLILFTTVCLLVLGAYLTSVESFPSYALAKQANIGEFIQRTEAVMAVIWFLSIFFKLSLCFYASARFYADTFKLSEIRASLFPMGLILVPLSTVIYPNAVYTTLIVKSAFFYFMPTGFLIPALLLVVARIRGLRTRTDDGRIA